MRRIITSGLLAMSLVAVTGVGAVAQTEPEGAIVPAGLNADKIDGRHAVGYGAKVRNRAGKLVATNKRGQLPSDIVKPKWKLILGKPAALRDGRITWGEVQNKPGDFADGKIGWGEVQGKPGGFADGVDNSHRNTLFDANGATAFVMTLPTYILSNFEVPSPNVHISVEPITPDRKLLVRDVNIKKSSDGKYRGYWVVENLDYAAGSAAFRLWITDFGTGPNGPTPSQIKAARSLEPGKVRKGR